MSNVSSKSPSLTPQYSDYNNARHSGPVFTLSNNASNQSIAATTNPNSAGNSFSLPGDLSSPSPQNFVHLSNSLTASSAKIVNAANQNDAGGIGGQDQLASREVVVLLTEISLSIKSLASTVAREIASTVAREILIALKEQQFSALASPVALPNNVSVKELDAVVGAVHQLREATTTGHEKIVMQLCAPGAPPLSSSLSKLSKESEETNKLLATGNEHTSKVAKAAENANEKKPPERPRAALPELIAGATESAARGLANLVKDMPWAKDALKGACHASETMLWLAGLGLSLPMILPTIIYGTIASLPTIGLSAIALLALATIGKHFMACLKYELKHTPSTPFATPPAFDAVKGTAAKVAA